MGPLAGLKVIEMAGLGPAPFSGMLLGDLGAEVLRIDRVSSVDLGIEFPTKFDLRNRNKKSVAINIKTEDGLATLHSLIEKADVLIEGYRPGVAERLGIGPDDCHRLNPRIVYGRATGWGQDGPLAMSAGHDINYIALTGALHCIGAKNGPPVPPLNLLGDYGGGALYLAFGIMCAVFQAKQSGTGQVVDSSMIDGVTSLMTVFHAFQQMGEMHKERGSNVLDGGAPYYGCFETKDGQYIAIGAIEERFYKTLIELIGLKFEDLPDRNDRNNWPELQARFATIFREKTRDEWSDILEGTDACFSPVLSLEEVNSHPHNKARSLLADVDGVTQPRPTPRFSATPGEIRYPAPKPGQHTIQALREWGIKEEILTKGLKSGVFFSREDNQS
ncbi:CoA transferase [Sneathiella chungangensis]|uniref:CoA transferase n=1 Tax=Sneathiella chungangensis TaxID=1418234 RepID=A0A845MGL2_9PROT|nr:CaiB/BaiF CoA-transferase family protein [Sneathiella chungangensis]MZR22795.1 CoA transferase [Sneathiella chungangensis]